MVCVVLCAVLHCAARARTFRCKCAASLPNLAAPCALLRGRMLSRRARLQTLGAFRTRTLNREAELSDTELRDGGNGRQCWVRYHRFQGHSHPALATCQHRRARDRAQLWREARLLHKLRAAGPGERGPDRLPRVRARTCVHVQAWVDLWRAHACVPEAELHSSAVCTLGHTLGDTHSLLLSCSKYVGTLTCNGHLSFSVPCKHALCAILRN